MININWEVRAKERRIENKRLKKKSKELTISRDGWKVKCIKNKDALDKMHKELNRIKKNLQKI